MQKVPRMRILHVDCLEEDRERFRCLLESLGVDFELEAAASHREAVTLLVGERFHCIVSELNLHDYDGLVFYADLRRAGFNTPFAILTSHGSEDSAARALRAGVDDYLIKDQDLRNAEVLWERLIACVTNNGHGGVAENACSHRHLFIPPILLKSQPATAMLIDVSGKILVANSKLAERLGKSVEDVVGENIFEMLEAECSRCLREKIEQALESRKVVRFAEENHQRLLTLAIHPISGEGGDVERLAIFACEENEDEGESEERRRRGEKLGDLLKRDGSDLTQADGLLKSEITGRLKAEEDLRWERLTIERFIMHNPNSVSIFDSEGRYIRSNDRFVELFGAVPPPTFSILDDPTMCELGIFEKVVRMKRGEVVSFPPHWYSPAVADPSLPAKNVYVRGHGFPLFNGEGHVDSFMLICEDLTEQHRAEEALRDSKERYQQLVENERDAILLIDADTHRLIDVNRATTELYGYSREVLLGLRVTDISAEPQKTTEFLSSLEFLPTNYMPKRWHRKRDNTVFPVEISASFFRLNGGLVYCCIVRDISERWSAENALRESEARFKGLSEVSSEGILIHDSETILDANSRFALMFGYELSELIGHDGLHHVLAEQKGLVKELESGGTDTPYEFVAIRKDGSTFPCEATGRLASYKGRKARVVSFRDVSQRKEAEKALVESEEKYRTISDQFVVGIGILQGGNFTYLNQKLADMCGSTVEDVLHAFAGGSEDSTLPECLRSLAAHVAQRRESAKGAVWNSDLNTRRSDGSSVWLAITVKEIIYEGSVVELVMVTDTTARKRAEEDLRKESDFNRNLVYTSPAFILAMDIDFKVLMMNRAMLESLGYSEAEVIGKDYPESFVPAEERGALREILRILADSGIPTRNENRLICSDGRQLVVEWHGSAVRGDDGELQFIFGIGIDISERKRFDDQLKRYQRKLRSLASKLSLSEESERRRIANELHDHVGQNMALAKMQLEKLERELNKRGLEGQVGEVGSIRELVVQSIKEARSLMFEISPPILYDLGFEAAVSWYAEQFSQRHGIKTVFFSDGVHKQLNVDLSVVLFQALRELMINVVKHAQAKRVQIIVGLEGDCIKVVVEDDGIGFDASRFAMPKSIERGFGLFSIIERLEHFSGTVEIDSRVGGGTRVSLAAPLSERR